MAAGAPTSTCGRRIVTVMEARLHGVMAGAAYVFKRFLWGLLQACKVHYLGYCGDTVVKWQEEGTVEGKKLTSASRSTSARGTLFVSLDVFCMVTVDRRGQQKTGTMAAACLGRSLSCCSARPKW